MDKAFQDLVWLSERLSGVIAVKDEIKNYSDLKNKVKGLEASKESLKKDVEALGMSKEETLDYINGVRESLKTEMEEAKKEAKAIVAKAKEQAKAQASKEMDAVEKVAKEAEDRMVKAAEEELISQARRNDLLNQIKEAEETLSRLNKEIDRMKAKFS